MRLFHSNVLLNYNHMGLLYFLYFCNTECLTTAKLHVRLILIPIQGGGPNEPACTHIRNPAGPVDLPDDKINSNHKFFAIIIYAKPLYNNPIFCRDE